MLRKLVLTSLAAALALTGSACASAAQDSAPVATTSTTAAAATTTSSGATTSATAPAANEPQRSLVFIAIGDDGATGPLIGCGDSAVAVPVQAADAADLSALMRAQLTAPEQVWVEAGLYNPLAYSELRLESAEIHDGTARVELSGELLLAGECDIPRVREQLTAPALQFDGVREVEVLINGEPLESLLDLRG